MPGQRDVNSPGFFGNQTLFFWIKRLDRLQIIDAVPEFETQYADILNGEQNGFTVGLFFKCAATKEIIVDFGQTVDQQTRFFTENALDVLQSCRSVFDNIMQDCCIDRSKIHPVPGGEMSNSQWMKEVWLPGLTNLVAVGFLGNRNCFLQSVNRSIENLFTETATIMRDQQLHDLVDQALLPLVIIVFRGIRLSYRLMNRLHAKSSLLKIEEILDQISQRRNWIYAAKKD